MGMSKEEKVSLAALKAGATLQKAVGMLPPLTPEQLAQMDENGDWIEPQESREFSTTEQKITSPPSI